MDKRDKSNKKKKLSQLTQFEKKLLTDLVSHYKATIENKKTDSVSMKAKNQAWQEIAEKFTSVVQTSVRSDVQLKKCWENLKYKNRKVNSLVIKENLISDIRSKQEENLLKQVDYIVQQANSQLPGVNVSDGFTSLTTEDDTVSVERESNVAKEENTYILVPEHQEEYSSTECMVGVVDCAHERNHLENNIEERRRKPEEIPSVNVEEKTMLEIKFMENNYKRREEQETELHKLSMKHKIELHLQRMRQEAELHNARLRVEELKAKELELKILKM